MSNCGKSFETAIQVNNHCEFRDTYNRLFGNTFYKRLPYEWEYPKMMWIDENNRPMYIAKWDYDQRVTNRYYNR